MQQGSHFRFCSRGLQARSWAAVSLLAALCLADAARVAVAAPPFPCDGALLRQSEGSSNPARYEVRGHGAYCEGVVARLNAGEIEVIGVHQGKIASAGSAGLTLRLSSSTLAHVVGQGDIVVLGTANAFSYRLDAVIPPGGLHLDMQPVIAALGIESDALGFLAWVNSTSPTHEYLPVRLSDGDSAVHVLVVSPIPLRRLRATVVDLSGNALMPELSREDVKERQVLSITIPTGSSAKVGTLKIVGWDYFQPDPSTGLVAQVFISARN